MANDLVVSNVPNWRYYQPQPEVLPPAGPVQTAPQQPSMLRRMADTAKKAPDVAWKAGASLRSGMDRASGAAADLGAATRRGAGAVAKNSLRIAGVAAAPAMEVAPHAGIYTDDRVPFADKLRVGASDALATVGGAAGGVVGGALGAAFGTGVAPGPGTVVGGVTGVAAGGTAGAKGGRALGNLAFNSDDVLRRHGYDPERGITDMFDGKGAGPTMSGDPKAELAKVRMKAAPSMLDQLALMAPGSEGTKGLPPGAPAGVARQGNSFGGLRYADGSTPKGTVSTVQTPGFEGYMKQLANIRATQGDATPSRSFGDGGVTTGQGAIGINGTAAGFRSPAQTEAEFDRFFPSRSGRTPREQAQMAGLRSAERVAGMRESGEMQRANLRTVADMQQAAMATATQRAIAEQAATTARRGQDMDFAGRLAPAQLAQQQRQAQAAVYRSLGIDPTKPMSADDHARAATVFTQLGMADPAKEALAAAGTVAEQSRKMDADTLKLLAPYFVKDTVGPDGKPNGQAFDEVLAAKAHATLIGLHGEKWASLPKEQKEAAIRNAVAQVRNQNAERNVLQGPLDRAGVALGLTQKSAPVNTLRDIRGATPETAGLLDSLRYGVSPGDTLGVLPNGKKVNYGVMDADQIEDFRARSSLR